MAPGIFRGRSGRSKANPDFLVAKGDCAAAVDRNRGADGRRILARRSLFRSLNRAMETSAKMKFLLDQIEDVGVRCGPAIDFIRRFAAAFSLRQ